MSPPLYSTAYLLERLERAVYVLAADFEGARSRLGRAYSHISELKPSYFPAPFQDKRLQIEEALTRLAGRQGYIIQDNLRKMRKADVEQCCRQILELYLDLSEHQRKIDV